MLRRLLATLFAVGVSISLTLGFLWAIDWDTALAQETNNCPPGFHWERYPSPIGCVQTELPAHGKIGFDGYAICEDGYVGDSERRPTTDGKPAPGSPYTSFPYLFGCYPPEEYAQLQAAGKLPSQTSGGASESGGAAGGGGVLGAGGAPGNGVEEAIRDASEALYDGGGGPSPRDLMAVGLGATGIAATLLGAATIAAGPPAAVGAREQLRRMMDLDRRNEATAWERFKALDERYRALDLRRFSINQRISDLRDHLDRLREALETGDEATWAFLFTATALGALLGGLPGGIAGFVIGLAGQGVTSARDSLQDLRVAANVEIAKLEQELKEVDKSLEQLGLHRHAAANQVKAARERMDFLESSWKKYGFGDTWYKRSRPVLPEEQPFWDF